MAIAYRSAGTYASGTGDVTPGLPTGYQADDIFILWVEARNNGTLSTPSGWTLITSQEGASGSIQLAAYWKRANASESAPTYTDTGNHTSAIIEAFSGCITSGDPYEASATGEITALGAASWPSVTTLGADRMIAGGLAVDDAGVTLSAGPTNSNLTGITSPTSNTHTAGDDGGIITFYGTKSAAGATGTTTGTLSPQTTQALITLALKPATGSTISNASGSSGAVATALAVGAALFAAVGLSSGDATVAAVSGGTQDGAAASSSVATATGAGKALYAGVGASAGVAAGAAVGTQAYPAVAASAGAASPSAVGKALTKAAFASAGATTVTGVGDRDALNWTGQAFGTSTAAAVGVGLAKSVAESSGTASAAFVGTYYQPNTWDLEATTAEVWTPASETPETWTPVSPVAETWH